MDRLIPDPAGTGATLADIVIEAISEQPEAKLALYRALEPRMKPDAVLATNTSSLSLETLRAGLARPERLVGIHFFNPVAKMPLVEVVHADGTAADALARASAVGQIDKLALPVKSAPGFLVNAVLAPHILQAMRSVDAGVAPAAIDAALVAFGMPMGPLELADTVGLDIARAAGEGWPAARSRRAAWRTGCRAASWAARPARASMPGATASPSGQGVRRPAGLAAGLIQPLIDATRQRVDQGIVADADLADAGVIFGTGFAPSRAVPCIIKAGPRRSAVEEIRLTPIDRAAEPGSAITTPIQHEEAVP